MTKSNLVKLISLAIAIGAFALLIVGDVQIKLQHEGFSFVSFRNVLTEIGMVVAVSVGSVLGWSLFVDNRHRFRDAMGQLEADFVRWKKRSAYFAKDFQQHLESTFTDWELTSSERDIALLIIKGLSLKEISDIRDCSDRTIRNHANTIYKKAGVKSRSELSAYFFEDLLTTDATKSNS
ncbi:MAG: helix-turn-helix transcriptional regulator [Bdellovibrio sp.]|nr:helix-turn-helix transcriptional regulator [Bdellovibrio sp.]